MEFDIYYALKTADGTAKEATISFEAGSAAEAMNVTTQNLEAAYPGHELLDMGAEEKK